MTKEENQLPGWLEPRGFKIVIGIIIFFTGLIALVFSVGTELSNNVTLIVEVGVGIIIAVIVYRITKKSEKNNDDTLKEIKKLETEQSNLIKEMKPIILKQGGIIEKQEEKERIRKENIFDNIRFFLINSKNTLSTIDELLEKETSAIAIRFDHEKEISFLDTSVKQITNKINELFSLEIETPREVLEAQGKLSVYVKDLKEALDDSRGYLETPPDPTEVIPLIDIAIKKLPEP